MPLVQEKPFYLLGAKPLLDLTDLLIGPHKQLSETWLKIYLIQENEYVVCYIMAILFRPECVNMVRHMSVILSSS